MGSSSLRFSEQGLYIEVPEKLLIFSELTGFSTKKTSLYVPDQESLKVRVFKMFFASALQHTVPVPVPVPFFILSPILPLLPLSPNLLLSFIQIIILFSSTVGPDPHRFWSARSREKSEEIYHFVLDVHFRSMEASPVAWTSFTEA
jgi:hypothetical protein